MADMAPDGGSAFPCEGEGHGDPRYHTPGMTLRDWFAGQALAGLLANSGGPIQSNGMSGWSYTNCGPDSVAREAYDAADAMIAERSKAQGGAA